MSWCERCLTDHVGLCLDERRRLSLGRLLAGSPVTNLRACPYCGVDGEHCPVLDVRRRVCGVRQAAAP